MLQGIPKEPHANQPAAVNPPQKKRLEDQPRSGTEGAHRGRDPSGQAPERQETLVGLRVFGFGVT